MLYIYIVVLKCPIYIRIYITYHRSVPHCNTAAARMKIDIAFAFRMGRSCSSRAVMEQPRRMRFLGVL